MGLTPGRAVLAGHVFFINPRQGALTYLVWNNHMDGGEGSPWAQTMVSARERIVFIIVEGQKSCNKRDALLPRHTTPHRVPQQHGCRGKESWIARIGHEPSSKYPNIKKKRTTFPPGAVSWAVSSQQSIDGGTCMQSWEFLPLPLAVPFIQLYPSLFLISLQIILIPLSYTFFPPPDPPLVFVPLISTQDPLGSLLPHGCGGHPQE